MRRRKVVALSSKSASLISRNSRNCLKRTTNKQLWFSDESDWSEKSDGSDGSDKSDWSDPSDPSENIFLKQNSHEHQNHSAHPLF